MGHTMTEEEREDLEKVMIRSSKYIVPKIKRAIYFLKDLFLFCIIGMGALLYYIFIFLIFSIIEFTNYFSSIFIKSTHANRITNVMYGNTDKIFGPQARVFRVYFIGR